MQKKSRRWALWLLLCGMLCTSTEQLQADFFYDKDGQFSLQGYSFSGAAIIAGAAICYAGYRYMYPIKKYVKTNNSAKKNNNSACLYALLAAAIALESMTLTVMDHNLDNFKKYFEEQKKIRELEDEKRRQAQQVADEQARKIAEQIELERLQAEKLYFAQLLHDDQVQAWKKQNKIYNVSQVQKKELLNIMLQTIQKDATVSIPLMAHMMNKYSCDTLIEVVHDAARLAMKKNHRTLTIQHINAACDTVNIGNVAKDFRFSNAARKTVAFHEAGHAIVGALKNNKIVVHMVSIVPRHDDRRSFAPTFKNSYRYPFEKRYAAGKMSILPVVLDDENLIDWSEEDLMNFQMLYFAGGIAQDIPNHSGTFFQDQESNKRAFEKFKSLKAASDDKEQIEKIALVCAIVRCKKNGFCLDAYNRHNQDLLLQARDQFMEQAHHQTLQQVDASKKEITQIAQLLLKHDEIGGDEVYKTIGKQRPAYAFEKK